MFAALYGHGYGHGFGVLWLGWSLYWVWSARRVKATARHEPLGSRLLHIVPLAASLGLLWTDRVPIGILGGRAYPWAPWENIVGLLLTAVGLGFAIWARVHIGANWSGTVTVKADHELIQTGPYAIVRHPIYTGLLVAIIGAALTRGDLRALLAVAIAWAALWRKLRLEERWMTETFAERYAAYRARVPALIPFSGRIL